MKSIILCCQYSNDWLNYINLGLAIFATLIAVGYLLKPCLHYAAYQRTKDNKIKWVVEAINKNLIPLTIKEIRCEMAVSKTINFNVAKTLELLKKETLILKRFSRRDKTNYIFVPIEEIDKFNEYRFLRIRLLASNFLGVKKHYERIYKINCLTNPGCTKLAGNCNHKRLTRKLKIEILTDPDNNA